MQEAIKIVNLRSVDGYTPKMKKVIDTTGTYEVELELEETPDHVWAAMFRDELMSLLQDPAQKLRRDPHLNVNSITFFTSIRQIENDGKRIAKLVDSVNEKVKQENIKITEKNKAEKGAQEEDEAVIRHMRDLLKKII